MFCWFRQLSIAARFNSRRIDLEVWNLDGYLPDCLAARLPASPPPNLPASPPPRLPASPLPRLPACPPAWMAAWWKGPWWLNASGHDTLHRMLNVGWVTKAGGKPSRKHWSRRNRNNPCQHENHETLSGLVIVAVTRRSTWHGLRPISVLRFWTSEGLTQT